jgi:hypothetical protein
VLFPALHTDLDSNINTTILLCLLDGARMIPPFAMTGLLPPGVHTADWPELVAQFGYNVHRQWLLQSLRRALDALRFAGCRQAYLDGSFVTAKPIPGDYDLCWSTVGVDPARLDPVLLKFDDGRRAMNTKYLGDLFPAEIPEGGSGKLFIDFFQIDKDTGAAKGIVLIDLRRLP